MPKRPLFPPYRHVRFLASVPNWRLEAAITGTLGSVPPRRGAQTKKAATP
jgi:hypothetical protein